MALTEQQAAAIERLRGNESLTGNLTDKAATAVLAWAEEQIAANAVYEDVVAAVRAGNRTESDDVTQVMDAAHKSLAAAQAARPPAPSPPSAEAPPAAAPPPPSPATSPTPSPGVAQSPPPPSPGGQKTRSKRKSGARK